MKIETIKNKHTLKVLLVLFALTNSEAAYSGMSGGEFAAIQGGFEAASKAATQALNTQLTEFSIQDNLMGAKASADSGFLKTQANTMANQYGGEYGSKAMNVAESCFNIPSFNLGGDLGFDMNFCGMDTLMGEAKKLMSDYSKNVLPPADTPRTEVEKKVETPKGTPAQTKKDNSKNNCIEGVDKGCTEAMKAAVANEKLKGVGKGGTTTTIAAKKSAQILLYDDTADKEICLENEWMDGTTEGYTCKKDFVDDIAEYDDKKSGLISGDSKLLDASEKEVRNNMIETNEKVATDGVDRINLARELRDEYNTKYNPSVMVYEDVEKMGEESFYKRNKDMLTKDPTIYIVPVVDSESKQFSFTKFGLEKYDDALKSFNQLKITDTENKPLETPAETKANLERMGGITPFSTALYGYEASLSAMANNIFKDGKENGEVGRELAIINGLKGNMFQSIMLNQQLENKARSDYNINIKQFTKLSSDNDELKNKIEQIQNQNVVMISVLKEIAASLKKIENK